MTHVFLSHHHPDHTMNVALFPNAEVVDFWARYKDDLWLDMPGDGYRLSPKAQLWLTPGHTAEDASLIVEADDGVYAMTHLWWHADRSPDLDPYCDDQDAIDGWSRPGAGCRRRGHPRPRWPLPRWSARNRLPPLGVESADQPSPATEVPSMRLLFGIVVTMLLVACGSASTPSATPPSSPAGPSAAPSASAPATAIDTDALMAGGGRQ